MIAQCIQSVRPCSPNNNFFKTYATKKKVQVNTQHVSLGRVFGFISERKLLDHLLSNSVARLESFSQFLFITCDHLPPNSTIKDAQFMCYSYNYLAFFVVLSHAMPCHVMSHSAFAIWLAHLFLPIRHHQAYGNIACPALVPNEGRSVTLPVNCSQLFSYLCLCNWSALSNMV